MPEGPSIVILKEQVQIFKGEKVLSVSGNTKTEKERLNGKKVIDFKSWGKQFLICFDDFFVRIHLLMFGSYRINERKENTPERLSLKFKNGELNFYTCSVKIVDGVPEDFYDWETDTMSDQWNPRRAMKAVNEQGERMVCDLLMDQNIFTGVGNIIKNEVLFRIRVHPETLAGALSVNKKRELVKEARNYCFEFYEWKKIFELRKHWLIYRKQICPRCKIRVQVRHTGKGNRRSFFCTNCQKLYPISLHHSKTKSIL
jgi:endonuclease-8